MGTSQKTAVGIAALMIIGALILWHLQDHLPSNIPATAAPSSGLLRCKPIDRWGGQPANNDSPALDRSKLNQHSPHLSAAGFSRAVSNRLEALIAEQTSMLEATRGLDGNALRAAAGLIRLFQERELDELMVTFPKESRRDLQATVDRRVTIPDGYPAPTHPLSPSTGP